ncbi:MotA/TolQ/ExbB proton channel family protein [candidate division KSB1 bacterium]|nr:MotA/TolQ/ExbB proton channel family protein [candidate division KSB1 bacterium]NIR72730.1 MotA/TolQ/ExbB proton channel family protein [candidate division KSB1 bacterium]NIS26818.1 MotA/TolQ/ExbB proton channel family protein [candidate division KSB1 bacterium]NIT73612.1 MotA/TolQ/ExbB proton channel family protein [candidate division KSB1 bacterium]NIU27485.1 MotA/TolQ/ExbB proton channel family protein [candidate division KSB1 bacterium]
MAEIFEHFRPGASGWVFMWALLFTAAFMVAIAVERGYYIWVKSNINSNKFMAEIRKLVKAGKYNQALELCEAAKDKALPRVVSAGLRKVAESETIDFRAIQNSVDEGTLEVIPKLQERTGFLAMIGNVSTLIGLMGTIYGLILAFNAVSEAGYDAAQKSAFLAAGISTAMNTTLTGLAIAVPSILIYTFLHNKTVQIIDEIDEHTVKLINLITGDR